MVCDLIHLGCQYPQLTDKVIGGILAITLIIFFGVPALYRGIKSLINRVFYGYEE